MYILEDLFLSKYDEGKSINDLITNEYYITVPIITEDNENGLSKLKDNSDGSIYRFMII